MSDKFMLRFRSMVAIVGTATKIVCNHCEARLLVNDAIDMATQIRFHAWSLIRRETSVEALCPVCMGKRLVLGTLLGVVAAGADR